MVPEKKELISRLISGRNVEVALNQQPKIKTTGDNVDTPLDAGVFERDLLEDCFNFAFGHGLSVDSVTKFVQFFQCLLDDTVKKGIVNIFIQEKINYNTNTVKFSLISAKSFIRVQT